MKKKTAFIVRAPFLSLYAVGAAGGKACCF